MSTVAIRDRIERKRMIMGAKKVDQFSLSPHSCDLNSYKHLKYSIYIHTYHYKHSILV
jgi:hypothetical protein